MRTCFNLLAAIARARQLVFEARYLLLAMVAWFATSVFIGGATAPGVVSELKRDVHSPTELARLSPILRPEITYQKSELRDPKLLRLAVELFRRNALGLALILYLGGGVIIVPALIVFFEGWSCGAIVEQAGCHALLHRAVPHGLIEFPMIFCAAAIATLLAFRLYKSVRRSLNLALLAFLRDATATYIACLPVLIASSVIEAYGTRLLWGQ
jgi:uncharacterized membrane protein SpoIIM required for sporulation